MKQCSIGGQAVMEGVMMRSERGTAIVVRRPDGSLVKEYRKKKGITQEELSELLDITPHYMSSLERGLYNIKLEMLVKILNIIMNLLK